MWIAFRVDTGEQLAIDSNMTLGYNRVYRKAAYEANRLGVLFNIEWKEE